MFAEMKIDTQLKDTESGWSQRFDNFFLAATPQWFEWIGWTLVLGVLEYLRQQSESSLLLIILAISYSLFWRHIAAVLFRLEITGIKWLRNRSAEIVMVSVLSAVMVSLIYFFVTYLAGLASRYSGIS